MFNSVFEYKNLNTKVYVKPRYIVLEMFFFPAFYYAFLIVEENMTVLVHYHSYCSVNYKKQWYSLVGAK